MNGGDAETGAGVVLFAGRSGSGKSTPGGAGSGGGAGAGPSE